MSINENAPVITRAEIEILAPIGVVWQIHTAINDWPLWQTDIDSAELHGKVRVGDNFHWTTFGLDITSTITEVVEPFRIVWGGPAAGITAVHVWEFTETTDGVIARTEESWEGQPIDVAKAAMQAALDGSLGGWLRHLKDHSEASR